MKINTIAALKGGPFNWKDLIDTIKFKIKFNREHPDYFAPDGILLFCGSQGSGKTLSAVRYIDRLMTEYPKALLCTNVEIKKYEDRTVWFDSVKKFQELDNDEYGIIFFIDEIQLLFNSLESKGMSLNLFTTICQQRKKRRHIVGTSQIFGRITKGFREQCKYAVICDSILGILQHNKTIFVDKAVIDDDGTVHTDKFYHSFWFHSPRLYNLYDTTATIDRTNFDYNWEGVTWKV